MQCQQGGKASAKTASILMPTWPVAPRTSCSSAATRSYRTCIFQGNAGEQQGWEGSRRL